MPHLGITNAHNNVLTMGSPGRVRRVADYLEDGELVESERGLLTVHGKYKGILITASSSGMGPASVSITVPEVIEACDENDMYIIRLGTTGAYRPNIQVGSFLVTTEVDRAESTSDKIMGGDYVATSDVEVRRAILAAIESERAPFQQAHVGKTRVTDDIYFDALYTSERDMGDVLGVSMEFSVICALRDRYNMDDSRDIKVGNLLMVSDNPSEHKHIAAAEFDDIREKAKDAHIRSGLEALLRLRQG